MAPRPGCGRSATSPDRPTPGRQAPEPGKWVIMLPDGGVHFALAEESRASTLRPPLEILLGPELVVISPLGRKVEFGRSPGRPKPSARVTQSDDKQIV